MIRVLLAALLATLGIVGAAAGAVTPRYDIVLILSDDQRADTLEVMPSVRRLLGDRGVRFLNAFASTPLCCPSRATILTGLYAHHHGVLDNDAPDGGAARFRDEETIAVTLHRAGYRTAWIGKYMNEYDLIAPRIPPGWDEWQVFWSPGYFNYMLVENTRYRQYGGPAAASAAADYSTDVLAGKAVRFVETTPPGRPLFLAFAPYAPHDPARPHPRDADALPSFSLRRTPSFNEADMSDKPAPLRRKPLLTAAQIEDLRDFARRQAQTLLAVDRAVARLVAALERSGRGRRAVIIYMSDNGLAWGEHRINSRKACPYDECARIPLIIRAPGLLPRRESQPVSTIDIAPTIAQWAGTALTRRPDGRSLIPLLQDSRTPWRQHVLLEVFGQPPLWVPDFQAVRTARFLYVRYVTGAGELYDLARDPWQVDNVYGQAAFGAVAADLQRVLDTLRSAQRR
ncbi:MAG TPA: sulfatase [bacterium]|nr:sulfatase [bacterium]